MVALQDLQENLLRKPQKFQRFIKVVVAVHFSGCTSHSKPKLSRQELANCLVAMNMHNAEFVRAKRCRHMFCISIIPKNVLERCYCNQRPYVILNTDCIVNKCCPPLAARYCSVAMISTARLLELRAVRSSQCPCDQVDPQFSAISAISRISTPDTTVVLFLDAFSLVYCTYLL